MSQTVNISKLILCWTRRLHFILYKTQHRGLRTLLENRPVKSFHSIVTFDYEIPIGSCLSHQATYAICAQPRSLQCRPFLKYSFRKKQRAQTTRIAAQRVRSLSISLPFYYCCSFETIRRLKTKEKRISTFGCHSQAKYFKNRYTNIYGIAD